MAKKRNAENRFRESKMSKINEEQIKDAYRDEAGAGKHHSTFRLKCMFICWVATLAGGQGNEISEEDHTHCSFIFCF